jgi:peptidoglycan/xylan/chitin deacetylase (PgdA/CDA1 family)
MYGNLLRTAGIVAGAAVLAIVAPGCNEALTVTRAKEATAAQPKAQERVDKFWARAKQEVYKSPEELLAQHNREVRQGLPYPKLLRGNPKVRSVALTFDDGPHPQYTPQLLAVLAKYNVKATFFVIGHMAEAYPDLIRAEHQAGHCIGNHTYHHVNLTKIPEDEVETEWQACNVVVKSILGLEMKFCRPPGGDYDRVVILAARDVGLTTVLWTDDPGDYAEPGDKAIEKRTLGSISSGAVILLHDGIQETINVLPHIIETVRARGFKFQTVEEMSADTLGR